MNSDRKTDRWFSIRVHLCSSVANSSFEVPMRSVIRGKAYVLGDNIDTDQIIPAQYLTLNPAIPEEYRAFGKYALSSVPPDRAGLPKGHVPFHGPDDEFVSPYAVMI